MAEYKLTREEQATTINWDASSSEANIYTAHPVTLRKLEKLSAAFPEVYRRLKRDRWGGMEEPVACYLFAKAAPIGAAECREKE